MRNINDSPYKDLMNHNVAGKMIRKLRRVLIYGTCIRYEHSKIYESISQNRVSLAVCLEREHFNMVALKVASMLARVKLEELIVLTIDGSPHCVQLHMAIEEALKITKSNILIKHLVIENGEVIEIPPYCVKLARYLSKIKKLQERIKSIEQREVNKRE